MKVLLDTNIIIHRETHKVVRDDIGVLFNWIDRLQYEKYIHPHTVNEISRYKDPELVRSIQIKLGSYNTIQAIPPLHQDLQTKCVPLDKDLNDRIDTEILNIQYLGITDLFITEDRKLKYKARLLGIQSQVVSIEEFLERNTSEHPDFKDYKVLAVRKLRFGNVNLDDPFFDSFRQDYVGFDQWYRKKNDDHVYVCVDSDKVLAFLYLKVEDATEVYRDIEPAFFPKKRLKIGTFKVVLNGYKLGERFLKVVFDNALENKVDEIYVTIFKNSIEQERLVILLESYGFTHHGSKTSSSGTELVYVRAVNVPYNSTKPKLSFPLISRTSRAFIVPIYDKYHTELFPDSILRTESPADFVENQPHRNAISKVYISRSHFQELVPGDTVVFYRTGGVHKGVITTVGIVEGVVRDIRTFESFREACGKRSVFTVQELREFWDYYPNLKPFVVNFLYAYSFPRRPNLRRLVELGIIQSVTSVPRGFEQITSAQLGEILKETSTNESFVVN